MTHAQKLLINSPTAGLLIWCSNCGTKGQLQAYNGIAWIAVDASIAADATLYGRDILSGNGLCTSKIISATPCSSVVGATLNDDLTTTEGIEYDWSDATSDVLGVGFGATTNTRSLVQIGQQCWAKFNSKVVNANYSATPDAVIDTGYSAFYGNATTEPAANEGRLYQWSAAMNSANGQERGQGVCPVSWHVPSDCDWLLLENTLGMTLVDQTKSSLWRDSGTVALDLSLVINSGTNSSGFSALIAGSVAGGTTNYSNRGVRAYFWTSSLSGVRKGIFRFILNGNVGVFRTSYLENANPMSVRCLKN